MNGNEKNPEEEKSGMFVGGSIVLGIGLLFLLVNMDVLPPLEYSWPFFMIIVGAALIIGGFAKKSKSKSKMENQ